MADEEKRGQTLSEALLDLGQHHTATQVARAIASTGLPDGDEFNGLVKLEIGGACAINFLLAAYSKRMIRLLNALPAPHRGDLAEHAVQAVANALVGGITGYVDDMPLVLRRAFVERFVETLGAVLAAREAHKRGPTNARH